MAGGGGGNKGHHIFFPSKKRRREEDPALPRPRGNFFSAAIFSLAPSASHTVREETSWKEGGIHRKQVQGRRPCEI